MPSEIIDRTAYSAPFSLSFNLTSQCNLSCLHCSASVECPPSDPELSDQEIWQLIEQAVQMKIFSLTITGGEPLLHPQCLPIMRRCSHEGMGTSLLTNATLVTPEVAEHLTEIRYLQKIQVSLDGATSESHEFLRGQGSFAPAMAGLAHLTKKKLPVVIACVVHRQNLGKLGEVVTIGRELGVDTVSFIAAKMVGNAKLNQAEISLSREELAAAVDETQELTERNPGFAFSLFSESGLARARAISQCGGPVSDRPALPLAKCDIGKECITVRADGWVVPCNHLWELKCGNIRVTPLKDIYTSSQTLESIRGMSALTVRDIPDCKDCVFVSHCGGGCRAQAYAESGSVYGKDSFRCIADWYPFVT